MAEEFGVVENDKSYVSAEDNEIPYVKEIVRIKLSFVNRYVNGLWNVLKSKEENCKTNIRQLKYILGKSLRLWSNFLLISIERNFQSCVLRVSLSQRKHLLF